MRTFTDLLNAGDLDGLVGLYEPSAVFEPQPGVVARGHCEIRRSLRDLVAIAPTIVARPVGVLHAGDVALVVNDWALTGTAPDGARIEQAGRSTDVVRRQGDGRWLVAIDKP